MNTQSTLVVGGKGKTGRRIVARLEKRGVTVRVGSRSGNPPFDWDQAATWEPMVRGVHSAYICYYPEMSPGAAGKIRGFARMAVACGLRKLVLLSARGDLGVYPATERAVQDSGAEWTILRPSWFAQNFSEMDFLLEPLQKGELGFPVGDVGEPFIDVEDIADVAVAALLDDQHAAQIYEMTGPRILTFAEAVAEIGRAAGRDLRYNHVTTEKYASGLMTEGHPADLVNFLIGVITKSLDGHNAKVADGVQRALGRQSRDFEEYVRETAATGIWASARGGSARRAGL
jgi:uncharacterized protein YbjT (DUF2867 family)